MSRLAIAQPLVPAAISASAGGDGLANLLTPSPREAYVAATAGTASITLDLGFAQQVDTVLLGYTNAGTADRLVVAADAGGARQLASVGFAHSYRRAPLRHAAAVLAAPIVTRYLTLATTTAQPLVAGVAAVGLAIRPEGYEWGGGRAIADASRVERLASGGFGVERGGVAGGWTWTTPTLTDEELERLYALALDVGVGGDLLVIEDPDAGPALNERIHWGKFVKLEPFARQAPGENKWAMQVQDWA